MKSAAAKLRIIHRNSPVSFSSPSILQLSIHTTAVTNPRRSSASLTNEELNQINAVVHRLCSSNHLKHAVSLISAALSTADPPLSSLPLAAITNKLALEPDLTLPMHFLNSLKHNLTTGNPKIILPIAKLLVSALFRNGRPKSAAKVFQWVSRPDFPGKAAEDTDFYAVLVGGFLKSGMTLDSIRVVRAMASDNVAIGEEVGSLVYRGLLREARVGEALGLRAALGDCTLGNDGGTMDSKQLVELLDRMITDWGE